MAKSRMTEKQDDKLDKKQGIRDGGKKDRALDKARGLPADKPTRGKKRK